MRVLIVAAALAACAEPAPPPAPASETQTPTPTATASAESALAELPNWENAREAGVDFRAIGQEPGWILDIYQQDRMTLLWDYGENRIELPRGEPSYPQEGLTRYEAQGGGHTLVVSIRRYPCQDAMSGEAYPTAVEVTIDGRALEGCGRSV